MIKYKIKLDFIRDLLGSQPASEDIRRKYITAKMMTGSTGVSAEIAMQRVDEEIDNLKKDEDYQDQIKELGDKALTVFPRDKQGKPSLSDIQLRGFIKDSFSFVGKENSLLKKKSGEGYSGLDAYKKWIGERIMFPDQYMPLPVEIDIMSRPLRCMTMQGPRVSIASSERAKAPFSLEFTLVTTDDVKEDWLKLTFDRGMFKGCSQWANGQWGTFTYEIKKM